MINTKHHKKGLFGREMIRPCKRTCFDNVQNYFNTTTNLKKIKIAESTP